MKIIRIIILVFTFGCEKIDTDSSKITGSVKDSSGKPIPAVQIIVDNSVFLNSNMTTKTASDGTYSISLPTTGSWFVFAIHKIAYNERIYKCYLQLDNPAGFGPDGAIRNFIWKLSGKKTEPLIGYHGGTITVDHFPGVYLDTKNITFTLTPKGNLLDGSKGKEIVCKAIDGHQIHDIPIGRYSISARYDEQIIKLREWNSDDSFQNELTLDFEPHIDGHCDNCVKLEYTR